MSKKQKNPSNPGSRALRIVQRYHPNVTEVIDSTKDLEIQVTEEDDKNSKLKDHAHCAMARACQRKEHADGAIISVRSAYIIKGNKAIRYRVPESVSREVISFDRKGGFNPGTYHLSKPSKWEVLGNKQSGKPNEGAPRRSGPIFRHKTENIRTSLNLDTV